MRLLRKTIALLIFCIVLPASAAGKFYTQQEFDTLLAEGKTLVVHIHADWCGTCKAQDVQINAAMNSPEFKDVVFFEVDYDTQRKYVKFFNGRLQSTIIIFKAGKEIDRVIAERDASELQAFLKKSL
jgi:thiol-disulfide isomerase/thioredoxin